jgi:hypothetical protein
MSTSPTGSADTGTDRNPGTVPGPAARGVPAVIDPRRDIMHPMFKELFIQTDADDLAHGQAPLGRRHPQPIRAVPGCGIRKD